MLTVPRKHTVLCVRRAAIKPSRQSLESRKVQGREEAGVGENGTTSTPHENRQVMSTATQNTKTTLRVPRVYPDMVLTQSESGTSHSHPHVRRDRGPHQALVRDHTQPIPPRPLQAPPPQPYAGEGGDNERAEPGPRGSLSPCHRCACTHTDTHTLSLGKGPRERSAAPGPLHVGPRPHISLSGQHGPLPAEACPAPQALVRSPE